MPTPTVYASQLTYCDLAPEAVQGTAATTGLTTVLLNKDPSCKDAQIYLEDVGMRNAMAEGYGAVLGPKSGDAQLDGDVRCDTQGFFLGNILGDWTQTSASATPNTTTSGASNTAGATAITVASVTGFTSGMTVQVGTGLTAEIFTIGTPSGSTLPIVQDATDLTGGALSFTHASGQTVTNTTTPSVYKFSLQNAGPCQSQDLVVQAHSLSIFDWSGVSAGTGARVYPGAMFSDLTYTIDPTKICTFSAKATTWGSSIAASTPPANPTTTSPIAAWTSAVGIGGPASGGTLMPGVVNATVTITRAVKVYPTLGQAQPYIIKQGKLTCAGKLTFIAVDESPLIDYLTNVQPQLQFLMTQGSQVVQIDMQQVYYNLATLNRGSEAVEFDVDFKAIANTTNIGASGGFSPVQVSLTNNVALGTY